MSRLDHQVIKKKTLINTRIFKYEWFITHCNTVKCSLSWERGGIKQDIVRDKPLFFEEEGWAISPKKLVAKKNNAMGKKKDKKSSKCFFLSRSYFCCLIKKLLPPKTKPKGEKKTWMPQKIAQPPPTHPIPPKK